MRGGEGRGDPSTFEVEEKDEKFKIIFSDIENSKPCMHHKTQSELLLCHIISGPSFPPFNSSINSLVFPWHAQLGVGCSLK